MPPRPAPPDRRQSRPLAVTTAGRGPPAWGRAATGSAGPGRACAGAREPPRPRSRSDRGGGGAGRGSRARTLACPGPEGRPTAARPPRESGQRNRPASRGRPGPTTPARARGPAVRARAGVVGPGRPRAVGDLALLDDLRPIGQCPSLAMAAFDEERVATEDRVVVVRAGIGQDTCGDLL